MSLASQISTSQAYRTSRGPDNDNVPLLLRINTHTQTRSESYNRFCDFSALENNAIIFKSTICISPLLKVAATNIPYPSDSDV